MSSTHQFLVMARWWAGLILWWGLASPAAALESQWLQSLMEDDAEARITAIQALASSGDPQARKLLQALADDALAVTDGRLVIVTPEAVRDASDGKKLEPAPENPDTLTLNNRVRRVLDGALAGLRLLDGDRAARLAAAQFLAEGPDVVTLPLVERALSGEQDAEIRQTLVLVRAQALLQNPEASVRLAAVRALRDSGQAQVKALLSTLAESTQETDPEVRQEAFRSLRAVASRVAVGETFSRIFSGLSLASILLLAALGLAITYGVMGVINMAHGELLMIGAYATYVVQGFFRAHLPEPLLDGYLIAAIPVAFLASASVGILMERTVIRWLYGRPLETLLATWGLSLILIQAVRVLFGPQNLEVANPGWMSGAVEPFPNWVMPWNRIAIIGFSLFVLTLTWALLNRTRLGLFVRAVTQNRGMAGAIGVPTTRIDTLAFGLGAGIAGLGGVALSQIANVGPDMGQGYIVDSFLVVVVGGVGQLAGAVWAALGLGIVSKFLEAWSGAVIAKILLLVFIIVFIQKRPQGLFALKGRFAEG
ncbi:urea transport system permease protein [Gammaproteobacteria bacterium]